MIEDDTTVVLTEHIEVKDTITIGKASGLTIKAVSTSYRISPSPDLSQPVLRIGNPACAENGLIKSLKIEGIEFSNAKFIEKEDQYGPIFINTDESSSITFSRVGFYRNQRGFNPLGVDAAHSVAALLVQKGTVAVDSCEFMNNYANEGKCGSAVWVGLAAVVSFDSTDFKFNVAEQQQGGGAVCVEGSATFTDCSFEGNVANATQSGGGAGGAVYISGNDEGTNTVAFKKTTFQDNTALVAASNDVWIKGALASVTFDEGTLCPECSVARNADENLCTCVEGEVGEEGEEGEGHGSESGSKKTSPVKIIVPVLVVVIVTGSVLLYAVLTKNKQAASTTYNPEFQNPVRDAPTAGTEA